jgi:parallel beta-helix repeat protein
MAGIGRRPRGGPANPRSVRPDEDGRRRLGSRYTLVLIAVVAAGISAFFLSPQSSRANTLEVGGSGYSTISAALQAAGPGDTILIHTGTYREQVNLSKQLTIRHYGDGPVTVDGECQRDHGVYIDSGSGMIIRGFTIKRTVEASILIDGTDPPKPSNVTVDGMTLQDFDCQELSDDSYRGGVAVWYGGSGMRITNNTITRRVELPGEQRGFADPIWFKSNNSNPSGGGHYIAGNTIIGGWDGIGGEEEGSAHGTFDRDSIVENNTVRDCWDDGIQSEGGDQNVRIRNNDVSGCGTGIAFAAPITGPLYIEDNYVHDLKTGLYGNLFCFKVGNNGSATTYLTENVCDVDSSAEASQGGADGIHQTNEGLSPIVSRRNTFHTSRYVFEATQWPRPAGESFDYDCMFSTDSSRFVKWGSAGGSAYYTSLSSFQAATGQEMNGRQSQDCASPWTPSPTPTGTPVTTPSPMPTYTAVPSSTTSSSPSTTTGTPTPTPGEPPLMLATLTAGWNFQCYVGASRPIEEAVVDAIGKISAVYLLRDGDLSDRWFPDRPDVSTLSTVNPGDTLFLLTSDPFMWTQAASDAEPMVTLAQGWNGVCYTGGSVSAEAATGGIDVPYSVIYTLAPDQTWRRFVPGNPQASNLSYLDEFTPVLILVTGNAGRWVFNP